MEISGEYRLAAPRRRVWEALQDPHTLQACIPGCESLERVSDEQVNGVIVATIGPVKSRFKTAITLSDLEPPATYTMNGEGRGGAAGFGRGSAKVTLSEDGEATTLSYAADLKVGGKLAQVGSRLVLGVARKIADQFFDAFAQRIGAAAALEGEGAPASVPEADKGSASATPWPFIGAAAAAMLVLWLLFGRS